MSNERPLISLITPTYNEAENIVRFLTTAHHALMALPHEIIVVDDNSPDSTWKIATQFAAQNPWVRVVRRMDEKGLSSAVLNGFNVAQGDLLAVMDADLSHDEKILPQLVAALQNGADVAVGSRRIPGGGAVDWPWYRRLTSSIATGMAKILLNLKLSDPMSGYFMVRRPLYEACKHRLAPKGYKVLVELCCKGHPQRIAEVPFIFRNRKEGYSKLTGPVMFQYAHMLLVLKFDRAIQQLRYNYHTGRYKKVIARLKSGSVLDIGCGQPCETMPDGAFVRFLGRGTGLDIKPCAPGFDFVQGSILELPFNDGAFDNVVAMEILEHVTDPHRAMAEIHRVVKEDGRIVVTMPRETWLWEKIWHAWENTFGYMWQHTHTGTMDPKAWKEILNQYFVIHSLHKHWQFDLIFKLSKKPSDQIRRAHETPQSSQKVTLRQTIHN